MTTLSIDHVSRWFGNVVAVNDITMTIGPGVTGLLGPNGAGKSTLINMMGGFLAPSTGKVTLDGSRCGATRPSTSTSASSPSARRCTTSSPVANSSSPTPSCTAWVPRPAQRALATVEMEYAQDRKISTYSKGMRQRVKMASALVHDPSLLLLDEPFNGMDPRQRMQLMELLRRMGDEGRTVLFSSHILEEVEQLAWHIEVVVAGRHAASGDFRRIRRLMTDRPHRYLVRSSDDRALAAALIADPSTSGIEVDVTEGALRIQAVDFGRFTALLPKVARDHGIRLLTVSPSDESLESVFSYLVAA